MRKVKSGKAKPKLHDMDPNIPAASWQMLRWLERLCYFNFATHLANRCIGSCTAYLEEITSDEERIGNIG
jgi:ubiquitin-conjugating enzyme E2 Q